MKQLILGAGNMIDALVPSYIHEAKKSDGTEFFVYTPSGKSAKEFASRNKITAIIKEDTARVDVLWLGMKPQQVESVAKEFSHVVNENTIIISVLAGTTCQRITEYFGSSKVIRIMPNTPSSIGLGVNAIYKTETVDHNFFSAFLENFNGPGRLFVFKTEAQIDTITPFSGSGPAYFFEIIRILSDDLSSRGIDSDTAKQMVALTLKGSAQLCLDSTLSPLELKNNVTSKNGVTYEALKVLEEFDLESIFNKAIEKAYNRTIELSK